MAAADASRDCAHAGRWIAHHTPDERHVAVQSGTEWGAPRVCVALAPLGGVHLHTATSEFPRKRPLMPLKLTPHVDDVRVVPPAPPPPGPGP